ncbi:helix-turn-helix domain-containing protein [Singulisphaera sp. Ch08]|uniref:helix-turn-helix domain-containing protein n=1 Tax=Singulisphaera sp. Ch08 TaxID=3120278 RepID=UPI003872C871
MEYRRRLAFERVSERYSTQEVADYLGVDPSTVRRWLAAGLSVSRSRGGRASSPQARRRSPCAGSLRALCTTASRPNYGRRRGSGS